MPRCTTNRSWSSPFMGRSLLPTCGEVARSAGGAGPEGLNRMRMYFPRRPTDSICMPATAAMNSSGSGWRTMVGNASSHRVIVRPTRCGRRSATIVSTSGSSGTYDRQLFHVGPVRPDLHLDLDAGLELVRPGHDARHLFRELVDLGSGHLEQQLVVDLQQHATLDLVGVDLAMQPDHRDLDDVRSQGLHREVDRHALSRAAELEVRRPQVGDRTAAARRADHESFFARLAPHVVEVFAESGIGRPVLAEKFARHVAGDAELLRKTVFALAVDRAKVRH